MAGFQVLVDEGVEDKEAWLSYRMGHGDWPGREVSHVEAELLAGVSHLSTTGGVIRGRSFRNPLPKFCFRFTTTSPPRSLHRLSPDIAGQPQSFIGTSRHPPRATAPVAAVAPALRTASSKSGACLRLRLRLRYPHPSLVCKTCTSTSTQLRTLPHAAVGATIAYCSGTTNISTEPLHARDIHFGPISGP